MAESIELGIVGIKNMGVYDSQTPYEKLNVVTYNGSSYCALKNSKGVAPTNTEYWQLYAEKGDTGPQGPIPVKGVDYFTEADKEELESDMENNLSDFISDEVSEQVGSLVSATPLAASSMSDMIDTTRIYVLITDGHWYWYNGTAWTDGGVYQTEVYDPNATLAQINDTIYETINLSELTWINGGVRFDNYKITTGDTDRIRNKTVIHAKKGSYLTLTDTTNYRWKISKYSSIPNNYLSYIGDVGVSSGLNKEQKKILDEDCFIVITIASNSSSIPIVDEGDNFTDIVSLLSGKIYLLDDTEKVNTELYKVEDATLDAYWSATTGYFGPGPSPSGLDAASRQFRVKPGQIIKIINNNHRTNMILGHFVNKDLEFISGFKQESVIGQTVPEGAYYAVFSMFQDDLNYYSFKITQPKPLQEDNYRLIYDEPKIKLIAHRGLNDFAPEHTIPAYTLAGEAGMWGLKIDICETADGYFVCSHDDSVDRMFDGTGLIRNLTLAEIQNMTVDSGSNISQYPNQKIVQLYEALEICKRYNMHPFIEFKRLLSPNNVSNVIEIIRSYGLIENTVCQCSDGIKDYLYELRKITDIIPISYWKSTMDISYNQQIVQFLGNAWLGLNSFSGSEISQFETYAGTLRDMHLPIHAAVLHINQINYARKWIKDYGLDSLVTAGITYNDLDY